MKLKYDHRIHKDNILINNVYVNIAFRTLHGYQTKILYLMQIVMKINQTEFLRLSRTFR